VPGPAGDAYLAPFRVGRQRENVADGKEGVTKELPNKDSGVFGPAVEFEDVSGRKVAFKVEYLQYRRRVLGGDLLKKEKQCTHYR
jgi:hypothetical protein